MLPLQALAIPATSVMTIYQFSGDTDIPYYDVATFRRKGAAAPAGYLSQGSAVLPCLVMDNGRPLTDGKGTPYVGYQIVMDSRTATPASAEKLRQASARRKSMSVVNHHCKPGVKRVINVRRMFSSDKTPFFDPPSGRKKKKSSDSATDETDRIIRRFHNSSYCAKTNEKLVGRRVALERAWDGFARKSSGRWSRRAIDRARALDYVLRTAIYEGHLDRGCSAYGACERNVIALSIRNRAIGACAKRQGCRYTGDFEGVASKVSQYNIWDEYLTQISGLTACFLRDDLGDDAAGRGTSDANADHYRKLQRMYAQSYPDVKRILYGSEGELRGMFPGISTADLTGLRHYYHPPAMGKCFPNRKRVEYMTGAVARKGGDFALIANTRVRVDKPAPGGYYFREFLVDARENLDVVDIVDTYPGFVIDKRKVTLKPSSNCYPYGIPRACRFDEIGRYRKVPSWLKAGKALELACRVRDQGSSCSAAAKTKTVKVGGKCDVEMKPVSGVR
ncbi:MAG: hypothetical protein U9Q71_01295 [Pseudomonadota bacterium]|nr:hypothetical protein [Pseudomonadota bacterium]